MILGRKGRREGGEGSEGRGGELKKVGSVRERGLFIEYIYIYL